MMACMAGCVCVAGGMCGRGHVWQGDTCGGAHAWQGVCVWQGAYMAGGMPDTRACAW